MSVKALVWLGPHQKTLLELSNFVSGFINSVLHGTNFDSWFVMPTNLHISKMFFGGYIFNIAFVLSGSACTPCSLTMCPRNLSSGLENSHLLVLRVTPAELNRFKVA